MRERLGLDRRALAVLFVTLLGFSIRVYRLDYQSFHYDEYFSVSLAGQSLSDILTRLTANEPHPPLYYSLLHVWLAVAGSGEFAAKFLSLIFATLVIPVGYRAAREVAGSAAGIVTALFLAVNPFQLYHAQETRMYSTLELLALASSFFFLRLLRNGDRRHWAGYVVTSALAVGSHYEALLLLATQMGFVLLGALRAFAKRRAVGMRRWLAAWAAIGALLLPWLIMARSIALEYKSSQTMAVSWPGTAMWAWQQAQELFAAFNFHVVSVPYAPIQNAAIALWAGIALASVLLWPRRRGDRRTAAYLASWLVLPVTLGLLLALWRPVFAVRYMVFASPALAMLLGVGVAQLARRSRWMAGLLALALALSYAQATHALYSDPQYARADYRGLFRHLAQVTRDGDALLLDCGYQDWAVAYYLRDRLPVYRFPLPPAELSKQPDQLADLATRYRRLWLVLGGQTECDPDRLVEQALAKVAYRGDERWFSVLNLVAYRGREGVESGQGGGSIGFGDALTLTRWSMPRQPFEPGEIVPVTLEWRAKEGADRDYAMSLRLLNAAGQSVVQRDGMPQDDFRPTSIWHAEEVVPDNRGVSLPPGLPPGEYDVELRVYDRGTGKELTPTQGAGRVGNARLGRVIVEPARTPPSLDVVIPERRLPPAAGPVVALGYDRAGPSVLEPGQGVRYTVYWQAREAIATGHRFRIRLTEPGGREVVAREFAPIDDLYPAWHWRPGEIVRLDYDFVLVPTVGSGQYRLLAEHLLADQYVSLFSEGLAVRNERPLPGTTADQIAIPRRVALDGGVTLLGYDVQLEGDEASRVARLILYWSAERDLERDYVVFVHALDATGRIIAQEDVAPVHGAYPTSIWPRGEIIRDEHVLPPPSGRVSRLVFGLYLPTTGDRLCLLDSTGGCAGDSITIESPFAGGEATGY